MTAARISTRPAPTGRCCPTTAAPASATSCRPCSSDPPAWPAWFPAAAADADQVRAARARRPRAGSSCRRPAAPGARRWPAMAGGPIPTVAPSTTATAHDLDHHRACTPGEHGVVGYRIAVDGEVLNVLRWSVDGRDARPVDPAGEVPADRRRSSGTGRRWSPGPSSARAGFTDAHLDGVRFHGYRVTSTPGDRGRAACCASGEPFVYAYYEGIDKVAHEYGLGEHYDAELRLRRPAGRRPASPCCRRARRWSSPPTTARSTWATSVIPLAPRRARPGRRSSRARAGSAGCTPGPGGPTPLLEAAAAPPRRRRLGRDPRPGDRRRLVRADGHRRGPRAGSATWPSWPGDPVAFDDPADSGPFDLVVRHGSLTSAEMLVPLLALAALTGAHGRDCRRRWSARMPACRRRSEHRPARADPSRPGRDRPAGRGRRRRPSAEEPSTSSCPSRPRSCGSAR